MRDRGLTSRWLRRSISISMIATLWATALVTLAPLLVGLAIADALTPRRRWARTRTLLFFQVFLWCEVIGVAIATLLWCVSGIWLGRNRAGFLAWNAALQRWWTGALFRGAAVLYGMRTHVEGLACADDGPFLLFARHASTADTVLPAVLVANRRRIVLRYVVKRELLWDPCLDIVGNRLPNAFVARSGVDREGEIAAVKALVAEMGPRDGVLIYPEGTRFTPAKLARARERLAASAAPAVIERAAAMRHVLPPRPGGPRALMQAAPDVDVIVLAHTGFEGARNFSTLWRGGLIGATVRVRLWRIPAADIPRDPEAQLLWLYDRWLDVDRWLHQWLDDAQAHDAQADDDGDSAERSGP